jgi:single-stranded-DNA-specific exonuclease
MLAARGEAVPSDYIDAAWAVASQQADKVHEISTGLRVPPFVARVLINRGIDGPDGASRFLAPCTSQLEDPFVFRHMEKAVARVLKALDKGEKILIQGDYDVDGSASAALLVNFFRLLGHDAEVSIPSRATDGYGLNERIIRDASARGVTLLITCDNGTTAHREIALGNELGIDTIVTDHHTVGETLPDALAVLNPHVKDEVVAYRNLCGAGVAFKFAWAISQRLSAARLDAQFKEWLSSSQSLVALASIADVVPLTGENRILTRNGLRQMPQSTNPGIRALLKLAGVGGVPTGMDVGFKLAPRLNAGGRLGRETLAVELLTARSATEAEALAAECDTLNRERQSVDRHLTKLAEELVNSDPGYEAERVLVLGHEEFHPGVVGIVASRISRRFNKPAVLVAMTEESGRGSGRSIPGFHLYNALNECADLMMRFGGHAQAAGLEIARENLALLRSTVNSVADKHIVNEDYATPTLDIDAQIGLHELDVTGVGLLGALEPFGEGNPEPVLMSEGLEVVAPPRCVGRGTGHLSVMVSQGGATCKAIGFGMGARVGDIKRGDLLRAAFTPRVSTFRGFPEVEIELKDVRPFSA